MNASSNNEHKTICKLFESSCIDDFISSAEYPYSDFRNYRNCDIISEMYTNCQLLSKLMPTITSNKSTILQRIHEKNDEKYCKTFLEEISLHFWWSFEFSSASTADVSRAVIMYNGDSCAKVEFLQLVNCLEAQYIIFHGD